MRSLELKVPPPVVMAVIAALMWFVSRSATTLTFPVPARNVLAIAIVASGFLTGFAGVVTFKRAKTTVNPTKPFSSSSLVDSGVYALTRNPMYLGGLVMLIGWAIFLSNMLAALLLLPAYVLYINRFQIEPEERALRSLFGQNYIAYQSRVRRWL